ncbi:MAG: hypothetical protein ACX94B_07445 [Henriciella sp.]|nr:hypothetical protein [Hyphomonadaceae bacterium]
MKTLMTLTLLIGLGACVSSTEFDRDRAYAKCESISDKSSRDRCIADAITQAERERDRDNERLEEFQDNADRRELGREIAGAGDQ